MENKENRTLPESRTCTVEQISAMLGISRGSGNVLVKEGHFRIVRIGSIIRISRKSFHEWMQKYDL